MKIIINLKNNYFIYQSYDVIGSIYITFFRTALFQGYLDQMEGELNDDIDIFENLNESGKAHHYRPHRSVLPNSFLKSERCESRRCIRFYISQNNTDQRIFNINLSKSPEYFALLLRVYKSMQKSKFREKGLGNNQLFPEVQIPIFNCQEGLKEDVVQDEQTKSRSIYYCLNNLININIYFQMQNNQIRQLVLIQEQNLFEEEKLKLNEKQLQGQRIMLIQKFEIVNLTISPNLRFLITYEKPKITEKSQWKMRSQLRIFDNQQNRILTIVKNVTIKTVKFTDDSKYLIIFPFLEQVKIFDIETQKHHEILKTNFLASIDQNNNMFIIDKEWKIIKYSIPEKIFTTCCCFQWVSKCINIFKEYYLIIIQQYYYILFLSNQKSVKQKKQFLQIFKNDQVNIFQRFLCVRMIENNRIEFTVENLFSGKTIRRIKNKKGTSCNIFENKDSTFFFGFSRIYEEKTQFFIFDLIRGIKLELIYDKKFLFRICMKYLK
ncbi:unnamed protein product [Paramecium octaurelia]|uniref:Uncharacterized protein n=1 Tax=Paramecium octaurelia TaxID=43137 RepID=A0A8S1YII1_PAROT|nr:unnamed protein product [Paramecium octaurelia]